MTGYGRRPRPTDTGPTDPFLAAKAGIIRALAPISPNPPAHDANESD
jgi:hypothetical protein